MKPHIALVLSGGGARGLAHIGVIEELLGRGYNIHSVAGTSMGSLVGGVFALGKMQEFKEWMYTLDRAKTFSLVDFTLNSEGIIKGDKVFEVIKEFIPDMPIEDLPIHFSATACDLERGNEVVFKSGSLFRAIRASVSIPTLLTPVRYEGRILVDGGLINNLPVSNVERKANDFLLAVDVSANVPLLAPPVSTEQEEAEATYLSKFRDFQDYLEQFFPKKEEEEEKEVGSFDLLNRTISIMMERITRFNLAANRPDLLINISEKSGEIYDFYRAEQLVEIGRYAAINALNEWEGSSASEMFL
ncbi:MAG: patatin-like phospholipase family protein [Bacteroidota bacterium]